jgi:hypothetical protein
MQGCVRNFVAACVRATFTGALLLCSCACFVPLLLRVALLLGRCCPRQSAAAGCNFSGVCSVVCCDMRQLLWLACCTLEWGVCCHAWLQHSAACVLLCPRRGVAQPCGVHRHTAKAASGSSPEQLGCGTQWAVVHSWLLHVHVSQHGCGTAVRAERVLSAAPHVYAVHCHVCHACRVPGLLCVA